MALFSQKIEAFGLDFSDLSLKIAKLHQHSKSMRLSCFGETEVAPGIIEEGEVKDEDGLASAIKKLLGSVQGEKLRTDYVVCSLPEEKSFLDILYLPAMKEEEYETAVRFEAENHLPVPLDDVYFGFEKIVNNTNSKYQEILIAATPKLIVDGYLSVLKKAKLKPVAMEIECLAIARDLIGSGLKNQSLLLVDFGGTRTSFIIFSGRSVRFTSTVSISSRLLTKLISKNLRVGLEEAEVLKLQQGLEGSQNLSAVLTPLMNDLVEQIKTHLEYFVHSTRNLNLGDGKVERILLCGGGANLKGLVNFLAKGLGIKIELGNPWVNILEKNLKEVPLLPFEQSLGYTTALGLALRGLQINN